MSGITRRTFLQASGAVAAASALGLPTLSQGAESKARVVVIGGATVGPSPRNTFRWRTRAFG